MTGKSSVKSSALAEIIQKPKPSRRPRKETRSTNNERQRAQLRRSQKAFHARKENYVKTLEEKCRRLEDIAQQMKSVVMKFGDSVDAADDVGQGLGQELKMAMKEVSKTAARNPNEEQGENKLLEEAYQPATQQTSKGVMAVPSKAIHLPPRPNNQTIRSTGTNFPPNPSLVMNHIWSASNRSDSENGRNALSYVLLGRDSFASRLYFETVVFTLRSLHGELSASIADRILRFKVYYYPVTKVRAILDSVLRLMLHGTSQPIARQGRITEIAEDQADPAVKVAITKQIELAGGSQDDYLSSWNVEQYLKRKWRLALDSGTVKVQPGALLSLNSNRVSTIVATADKVPKMIFPTMVPGFPENLPSIWNSEALIEKLKPLCVSVGEGPRWHVADIDEAVEAFLIEKRENGLS